MRRIELLMELFFPRRARCMGCGSLAGCDREDLCEECRRRLAESFIGVRMPDSRRCIAGAAFAYPYHGPAGSLVRRLKYERVWVLAEHMGREVAGAARQLRLPRDTLVTTVPMHPRRLRRRGKNHSELLAVQAAALLGMEYRNLLARTRNAPQQARLSDAARRKNLKGAFAVPEACREEVCGRRILLIDDVWTTGSTAESCAEALLAAGAARVYFASFALGEKKLER